MTENIAVLTLIDMSGSMSHQRDEVINGWNSHLKGLRKELKGDKKVTVGLTLFDSDEVRKLYQGSLAGAPNLTRDDYRPRAMTPLYDAFGSMIARKPAKADRVLVVVITDGLENASREYDYARLVTLIEKREKQGWSFLYLANDPMALKQGGTLTGVASLGEYGRLTGQMFSNIRATTHSTVAWANSGQSGAMGTQIASQDHAESYAKEEKKRTKAGK